MTTIRLSIRILGAGRLLLTAPSMAGAAETPLVILAASVVAGRGSGSRADCGWAVAGVAALLLLFGVPVGIWCLWKRGVGVEWRPVVVWQAAVLPTVTPGC